MTSPWMKKHWAAIAVTAIVAVTTLVVRLEGQLWFCKCGELLFVVANAWSPHTSQHLFDPYSLTHLQHGIVFYWALGWLLPRASWPSRLVAAMAIEAGWEMIENSQFVIQRYRDATAALGYEGDTVVNVLGDLLSCMLGFALAGRLGWRKSLAVFVVIEVGLLALIRDSLTLNVLMLFYPVDWLKTWQMAR